MTRISSEDLRRAAWACESFEGALQDLLFNAADTIDEMDKDIAVYEAQIDSMQRQHMRQQEDETP